MPHEKTELNILLTVDDDVRIDSDLPLDPFPHSIPHHDETGIRVRWEMQAYDRGFAGFWGFPR